MTATSMNTFALHPPLSSWSSSTKRFLRKGSHLSKCKISKTNPHTKTTSQNAHRKTYCLITSLRCRPRTCLFNHLRKKFPKSKEPNRCQWFPTTHLTRWTPWNKFIFSKTKMSFKKLGQSSCRKTITIFSCKSRVCTKRWWTTSTIDSLYRKIKTRIWGR